MKQGIDSGMNHAGVNQGMNHGMHPGVNPGMNYPGMNHPGMCPQGMNQDMRSGMSHPGMCPQGVHLGMNPSEGNCCMHTGINPAMGMYPGAMNLNMNGAGFNNTGMQHPGMAPTFPSLNQAMPPGAFPYHSPYGGMAHNNNNRRFF